MDMDVTDKDSLFIVRTNESQEQIQQLIHVVKYAKPVNIVDVPLDFITLTSLLKMEPEIESLCEKGFKVVAVFLMEAWSPTPTACEKLEEMIQRKQLILFSDNTTEARPSTGCMYPGDAKGVLAKSMTPLDLVALGCATMRKCHDCENFTDTREWATSMLEVLGKNKVPEN